MATVTPAAPPVGTPLPGAIAPDPEAQTYLFIVGWALMIVILIFINRTRVGHVIIYYSLLLMILLILVSEYKQLAPMLNVTTIGELNK